jgi:hypothetical protein
VFQKPRYSKNTEKPVKKCLAKNTPQRRRQIVLSARSASIVLPHPIVLLREATLKPERLGDRPNPMPTMGFQPQKIL